MVVQYIFKIAVPYLRTVFSKTMRAVIAVVQYKFLKVRQDLEIASSAITAAIAKAGQSKSREIIIQKLPSGRFLKTVYLLPIV